MGKFLNQMANNDQKALKSRAKQIDEQARLSQETLIRELKKKKTALELKLQDLTDFAPETTDSLRPGLRNWNPDKWVADVHNVNRKLYELELDLKIAEATYADFFGEDEADEDTTEPETADTTEVAVR